MLHSLKKAHSYTTSTFLYARGWRLALSWLLVCYAQSPQSPCPRYHKNQPRWCMPTTRHCGGGDRKIRVHPGQQNEFEASLSDMKLCLQIKKILTTSIQARADSVSDACYSIVAFKGCSGVTSYGEASCWRYTHSCTPCPLHQHAGVSNSVSQL